jgi:exportin-1
MARSRVGFVPSAQVGIKNFIVNLVIHKSSSEEIFRRERVFMTKLNVILVQIVKQEWPVSKSPAPPLPTAVSPRLD